MIKQLFKELSVLLAALFISFPALAEEVPQSPTTALPTVSIPVVQPLPETPPKPQITDPWPGVIASLKGGLYSTSAQQRYSALKWQFPLARKPAEYEALKANGTFVRLQNGPYLNVTASKPFVRPETAEFAYGLARDYSTAGCGQMTVTGAGRLDSTKLAGSSPDTVHPFGMAIDIRMRFIAPRCADWLRTRGLELEALGLADFTEHGEDSDEAKVPLHMHVVVPKKKDSVQLAQTGQPQTPTHP